MRRYESIDTSFDDERRSYIHWFWEDIHHEKMRMLWSSPASLYQMQIHAYAADQKIKMVLKEVRLQMMS